MKFLFIAGLIFFIGSIILIINNYEKFNIERNGHVVKLRIESLPKSCIGAKVRYFVTYSYNGEMYDKQTRGDFCERHHVGELIDMKVLEGSKYILSPNESALSDLISLGILGFFGLILSITQWKKIRNEK
ncbi:MAG: hypothetical protein H7320_08140 [Ferruginibacter sp.]|nr:hypothetical protein [Ferruginibacter sp.]